jgi:adenylate cyclase
MEKKKDKELLRRISRLVKQNKNLNEQVRQLTETNEKFGKLIDDYERRLSRVKTEAIPDKHEEEHEVLKFKMGTVLFADIQGFAKLTDQMDTQGMVDELDTLFFQFDSIVRKYKLEKIKTIGDYYMCAAGFPLRTARTRLTWSWPPLR